MKVLKIVGIVVFIVFSLALLGGYIFLSTLDVNKFIPVISEQVKKAIGRDLKIERADLQVSFFRGISLEITGISLSDDPRFSNESFLSADKVLFGLSLKPLIFERKIQIGEITVSNPKIVIIRNKEGQINAARMAMASAAGLAETTKDAVPAKAAALPALLVDRFMVSNATITYIDEMFSPRVDLTIDRLDLTLSGFSLTSIFSYEIKAAVLSSEQNLGIAGKGRVDLPTLSAWLTDGKLDLDLSKISVSRLNKMLPMASPAGLKDPIKGKLAVIFSEIRAGSNGLQELKLHGNLADGHVESALIPFPVEDLVFDFESDTKDFLIKSVDFHFAEGSVNAVGAIHGYLSLPAVEVTSKISGLELARISEAYKLPVKIVGKADADVKLSLVGKTPEEMTSSLKAELSGSLKDGTLEGVNLVQMGLDKIPMLPTLWDNVQAGLPPETQADLKKGVTLIDSCDVLARMNGMTATVERAEFVTRDVTFSAKGTVKVPDAVGLDVDFYLQKNLADALVKQVPDLEGIRVDQGRLYIPLKVSGLMVKPKVEPDVQYLSQKIVFNRGKQELEKVIEKNPQVQGVLNAIFGGDKSSAQTQGEATQPAGQGSGTPVQDKASGASQAADMIFNSLFKKKQ